MIHTDAEPVTTTVTSHEISFPALDGFTLAGTLYTPPTRNGRVILINSAMGVKQSYYADYAAFLAGRGFVVLTYDYRGIGRSKTQASLRGFYATLQNWGVSDQGAALNWLLTQYPTDKLLVIGHSLGGQMAGLTPYAKQVTAWLGIASQSGYWRGWEGGLQVRMFLLWHVVIPVLTQVYGYFPARLVGMGNNDLPAQSTRDWAKAGRHPEYIRGTFDAAGFDAFTQPMQLYSLSDDDFSPRQTVENLRALYPNAPSSHKHITPADLGVEVIGHFGFFRKPFEATLWTETAEWLEAQ